MALESENPSQEAELHHHFWGKLDTYKDSLNRHTRSFQCLMDKNASGDNHCDGRKLGLGKSRRGQITGQLSKPGLPLPGFYTKLRNNKRFDLLGPQRHNCFTVNNRHLIHKTQNGIEIYVEPGRKSKYDFKVTYREPGKRIRTPQHIHFIIDLYMKKVCDKDLTLELVKKFLEMLSRLQPSKQFPPAFQEFSPERFSKFEKLNGCGEYSVEFLTAIFDLIMIQEKTNYPNGTINRKLFEAFLNEKDIFAVVSAATFRGG